MKPPQFEYHSAADTAEAVRLLARYDGEAKVLAGGQSLMPMLNLRLATPSALVDINRIEGYHFHRFEGSELVVGATCRHADIETDPAIGRRVAAVSDAVPLIGHVSIRNRGTVVGSLAHADPSAEWPALAVLLDARINVSGPAGAREIAARVFFDGFLSTQLEPDELVTSVGFTLPVSGAGSAFVELARRHGDFALIGAGAVLEIAPDGTVSRCAVALCGAGMQPVRVAEAEQIPIGERLTEDVFDEVGRAVAAAVKPPSDIHASADYRRQTARVMVRRALSLAARRIGRTEQ